MIQGKRIVIVNTNDEENTHNKRHLIIHIFKEPPPSPTKIKTKERNLKKKKKRQQAIKIETPKNHNRLEKKKKMAHLHRPTKMSPGFLTSKISFRVTDSAVRST